MDNVIDLCCEAIYYTTKKVKFEKNRVSIRFPYVIAVAGKEAR